MQFLVIGKDGTDDKAQERRLAVRGALCGWGMRWRLRGLGGMGVFCLMLMGR